MRLLTAWTAVLVAVRAGWDDSQPPSQLADQNASQYAPEITVVEVNQTYVVKLDCQGCPFAVEATNTEVLWQQPPQDNALVCISLAVPDHTLANDALAAGIHYQHICQPQPSTPAQRAPHPTSRTYAGVYPRLASTCQHHSG